MKHLLFSSVISLSAIGGYAQCGPYVHHPLWPSVQGYAYINETDCGFASMTAVWDNGTTGPLSGDLDVGTHSVELYENGTLVETLFFEVEQLFWNLNQNVYMMAGNLAVDLLAEVPYCGTQILNSIACPPIADSTVVYLLQDGVAIDSITPVSCASTINIWMNLPTGYAYQLYLQDHSACGSFAYGMVVQTYSCAGATMEVTLEAATVGSDDGVIAIAEVVPDPLSPLPPPLPLTGTFTLYALPDMEMIGDQQTGTGAQWEQLPAGEYSVLFFADVICDPVMQEVIVDSSVGMGSAARGADAVSIWPVPVEHVLRWSGPQPARVWVTDLQGRLVLEAGRNSHLDVSALANGTYQLHLDEAPPKRFIKQ